MWDIDPKYLQKDETIEYTDRPNMLSCFFSYVWVGLMAFMFIMMIIMSITLKDKNHPILGVFAQVVYIALALPGIYIILKRLSTRYAITNRALIKRVGIITNNIKTVPFKHVTSIEVRESILGKIFRYAQLLIETSGSGQAIEFKWDYINSAHKVKALLEKHVGG